ncbi:MAG: type I-U CRISPR-associated RAMP protein Csb1/Cas7u [Nannocystaceae bacterium]
MNLPETPKVLIHAKLGPSQGHRFQPTGFPDIGPGRYTLPDGTEMVLVESEQSVANRLEAACWDESNECLTPALNNMPYVQVDMAKKAAVTTSLHEAHRLNSVYIEKSDFHNTLVEAIGYDKKSKLPPDLKALYKALLRYDPNSLIHGCFLESIAGTLRFARSLSGFIEATNIRSVHFGGVKNDHVSPSTADADDNKKAKDGYGNVPFHREAFTAESLDAYFNIDLQQIRSFGLPEVANEFLYALCWYKILGFLENGLRLRTACDLDLKELRVTRPDSGIEIPARDNIESTLASSIAALGEQAYFASPSTTVAKYSA